MHRIFRVKAYEAEHGPHFNEEHARKAVSKMENEDGTRGPHWSVEETTALASQYGINLGSRFNRYDWFVALNMVYSDYYKVIISMTNSNSTKHFFNRGRVRTVDNYGIPVLRTNYVTTDTTTTSVTYGVCPRLWRQLPCQGLFILHVTSTPASAATPTDLVFIDPTSFTNRQIDNTATVITSTGAKALLNGSGTQMTNNEITTGNRYLIYYNKCDGIFQVINHIVTPTTPAT